MNNPPHSITSGGHFSTPSYPFLLLHQFLSFYPSTSALLSFYFIIFPFYLLHHLLSFYSIISPFLLLNHLPSFYSINFTFLVLHHFLSFHSIHPHFLTLSFFPTLQFILLFLPFQQCNILYFLSLPPSHFLSLTSTLSQAYLFPSINLP